MMKSMAAGDAQGFSEVLSEILRDEEKSYLAELSRQGVKETWKYGIAFWGKNVRIERG